MIIVDMLVVDEIDTVVCLVMDTDAVDVDCGCGGWLRCEGKD